MSQRLALRRVRRRSPYVGRPITNETILAGLLDLQDDIQNLSEAVFDGICEECAEAPQIDPRSSKGWN